MFFVLTFFALCIVILFFYLSRLLKYWKNRNIPFVASDVWTEIITEFYDPVAFVDRYKSVYNTLAGRPFGGCFQQFKPQLFIRDPDLIRRILSTDFDHFRDRGNTRFVKNDPLTNNLFSAPGPLWKRLRIRLTPTFTSAKMKYMFDLVKECAEEFQQSLLKSANKGELVDIKDYTVNYTIEVISSTAFGLKTNSMALNSEFKRISQEFFPNRLTAKLRLMLFDWFPSLQAYLQVSLFNKKINNFFFNLIRDTVNYRKENSVSRNDFLQILMSLNESSTNSHTAALTPDTRKSKDEELEFTTELMTAQCFLIFFAGFDTSSLVVSATLLELAVYQDIQDRLLEEIDHYTEKFNNNITYEIINEMPYLHKVLQESMRKYPVIPVLSRVCSETYQIPDSDVIVDKGTEVIISVAGLHYDQEYFPDPDKFDPERFSDEEMNARHKFVYLPFGGGPRSCIGSRFGLVTVKLGLVHLLQKYRFDTTPETVYPVKFKPFKKVNDYNHKLLLRCSVRNRP